MGQYKVPQNVEAEDKILGPLSLKQFIYALIGLGYGFLTYAIFKSVIVLWLIIGLPPTLAALALGLYQREDQPFENYFIGVLQYLFRPRKRFWEKEPIAEIFRLEPPPLKAAMIKRDPHEVRGQLEHLAQVVDTRGWSTKMPEVQEPELQPRVDLAEDRITSPDIPQLTQVGAESDITAADDMLDENNPSVTSINTLMENTVKNIRQEALQKMQQNPPKIKGHKPAEPTPLPPTTPGNPQTANAIIKLATEGGELTVAQVAAQAKRTQGLAEGQPADLRQAQKS